jgi:hypothetical protein
MYTDNRDAYRQFFFSAWQKFEKKLPLDATEARLAALIQQHPEYHSLFEHPNTSAHEYAPEENPFIHLSLHLALREQIETDRPKGIGLIQQELNLKLKNPHQVEHLMMECLCRMMGLAQETGNVASDEMYLTELRGIT